MEHKRRLAYNIKMDLKVVLWLLNSTGPVAVSFEQGNET